MNTDSTAASAAFPPQPFIFNELPYAQMPDIGKVFKHAHAVFRPVPLIQVFQSFARHDFA